MKASEFTGEAKEVFQKQAASRVSTKGAKAWKTEQDAGRPLREVTTEPACLFSRGFLKYATTGLPAASKSADLAFYTDKLPSHVFLEETFKEEVVDGVFITENGLFVDMNRNCYSNFYHIVEDICAIGNEIILARPGLKDEELAEAIAEVMSPRELYNLKTEGILNWAGISKAYMTAHQRPEAADYTLEDLLRLIYKAANPQTFINVAAPMLYDMVKMFSKIRTDIIIWGAPIQETDIMDARFSRGSIATREEDEGKMQNDCYALYRLSHAISLKKFLDTADGSPFRNDPDSKNARTAYSDWAFAPKMRRAPWKSPRQVPIHFCLSSKAKITKDALLDSQSTNQPVIEFGYFTSSLGESGKLNKLQSAMVGGKVNDDPDVAFMYNSYLTSDDKSTASKNMTAEEITFDIGQHFSPAEIAKGFFTLAADTQHKKVRVYDSFSFSDNMLSFRKWVMGENTTDGSTRPIDMVNPTDHEQAFKLLGINLATNIDSIVDGITNTTAQNTTTNAMAAAAAQATAPAQDPAPATVPVVAPVQTTPVVAPVQTTPVVAPVQTTPVVAPVQEPIQAATAPVTVAQTPAPATVPAQAPTAPVTPVAPVAPTPPTV